MAHQGRLYTKPSGEGGADVVYDGAAKSAFDEALGGKHSAAWEARAERFHVDTMAPDVDYHAPGIADAANAGKPSAVWAQQKPRFEDAKPEPAHDYHPAASDFDKAAHVKHTHAPDHHKDRSAGWITQPDQVGTPSPGTLPGAFDDKLKKSTPSPFAHHGGDRFKDLYTVSSHGEPAATALQSDFDKAARNNKPSAASMTAGDRFKEAYDVASYGDPGAHQSAADIERHQMEAKIAHQKAQADADAARALQ